MFRYKRLPFGLRVSTHVFSLYMVIHLEVAKGRFLTSLIPKCVSDSGYKRNLYDNCERLNYGIIHPDDGIRRAWEKII